MLRINPFAPRRAATFAALAAALAAVALLSLALARAGGQTEVAQAQPGPDPEQVLAHFSCYAAFPEGPLPPAFPVELADQFGLQGTLVLRPLSFCNPTTKAAREPGGLVTHVAPIPPGLEFGHLTCYEILPGPGGGTGGPGDAVPRVEVTNQFGTTTLTVGFPRRLCVPSEKTHVDGVPEPPSPPAEERLAHFKCYTVVGGAAPFRHVELDDQFGFHAFPFLPPPTELCNPAKKLRGGVVTPIPVGREFAHLVCYPTPEPLVGPRFVEVRNQFGPGRLFVPAHESLCVPSTKRELPPPTPELSHFKCYDAKAASAGALVGLTDQFVKQAAEIRNAEYLCNPAQKEFGGEVTPIENAAAHLECYALKERRDFEGAAVEVTNQFGRERLEVGKARSLCAPTLKSETEAEPGAAPANISHFKCYDVKGRSDRRDVVLTDQFGEERGIARNPVRLCNPVEKEHEGATFPLVSPPSQLRHLVCYELKTEQNVKRTVLTRTQFGLERVRVDKARLLCVPSEKTVL